LSFLLYFLILILNKNVCSHGMVWYGLFNRIIKHGYNKYI
jgi:hypothetical protein